METTVLQKIPNSEKFRLRGLNAEQIEILKKHKGNIFLALSAIGGVALVSKIIKEYNSNHCLDYAQVQESLGSICLITANISQAKTHFKKALKIYEDIWADEPELIEEKYQAIQELYPQAGIALAKSILLTKH